MRHEVNVAPLGRTVCKGQFTEKKYGDLEMDYYGKGKKARLNMTAGLGPLETWVPKMRGGAGWEGGL